MESSISILGFDGPGGSCSSSDSGSMSVGGVKVSPSFGSSTVDAPAFNTSRIAALSPPVAQTCGRDAQ